MNGDLWSVPREWPGERCFILCSGESVSAQRAMIDRLRGRMIAVKHGVLLRRDADVLFLAGERCGGIAAELIPKYRGGTVVIRGKGLPDLPADVKRIGRWKNHGELCDLPTHVSGRDSGTSAINLAYHFGATEIVLLGYDMRGGHFCQHPLQYPPREHFVRHIEFAEALNRDAKRKGVRIVNCSPISVVHAFERRPLEAYL